MKGKDLLSIADLDRDDFQAILSSAISMKLGGPSPVLAGKTLALIFEKPSLRTRVSFEMAMWQAGGRALYLSPAEVGLGKRESVADVARVLSRYVDIIAARTSHANLKLLSKFASVPVINALSEVEHPCQALADMLTIYEKKKTFKGVTVAYLGDGNNVAHSLMLAASLAGMSFRIASPNGYSVNKGLLETARSYAAQSGGDIVCTDRPELAVNGADVVYTDVWTSMGQEDEAAKRRQVFARYQVNAALCAMAKPGAIVMHPLPAHRGEEITDDAMESPGSVVFDQAENRMHAQKALLVRMLGAKRPG